jgi:predicted site-specific integrase-resolvase
MKDGDRRPRLKTTEVAEMFGVTRITLQRWMRDGKIPEPARDPDTNWPIWQQPELDAIAKLIAGSKNRKLR